MYTSICINNVDGQLDYCSSFVFVSDLILWSIFPCMDILSIILEIMVNIDIDLCMSC